MKYFNDWLSSKKEGMMSDFGIDKDQMEGVKVIFAAYSYENYSGDAFVLFEKNGKLYEVHGSHCSCYGLEGQWEPEESSASEITYRLVNGDQYGILLEHKDIILDKLKKY